MLDRGNLIQYVAEPKPKLSSLPQMLAGLNVAWYSGEVIFLKSSKFVGSTITVAKLLGLIGMLPSLPGLLIAGTINPAKRHKQIMPKEIIFLINMYAQPQNGSSSPCGLNRPAMIFF